MASRKSLEPHHSCAETKEEQRQLKCINRSCRNGGALVDAVEITCHYYDVDYSPGKEVIDIVYSKLNITHR